MIFDVCSYFEAILGVILIPRGQIFGYFWRTPTFVVTFTRLDLCNKMIIWITPSPSTVHVVYGCPHTYKLSRQSHRILNLRGRETKLGYQSTLSIWSMVRNYVMMFLEGRDVLKGAGLPHAPAIGRNDRENEHVPQDLTFCTRGGSSLNVRG